MIENVKCVTFYLAGWDLAQQWASYQICKITDGLRMRREFRKRLVRHRLQRKPLVSDSGMHHATCVTHVPWCMWDRYLAVAGKRFWHSRDSRRMRNPQFCVSGRRPMVKKSLISDRLHWTWGSRLVWHPLGARQSVIIITVLISMVTSKHST